MAISRFTGISLLLAAGPLGLLQSSRANDQVSLANTSGAEIGIMAEGQAAGGMVTYASPSAPPSTKSSFDVGLLTPSSIANDVVAFTNHRPVALATANWTGSGSDVVPISFADEIPIPISVWILRGTYSSQKLKAGARAAKTALIWASERMGLTATWEYHDMTTDPHAGRNLAFECGVESAGMKRLLSDFPPAPGRINIYVVDTVDGETGAGQSCLKSNAAVLGSTAGSTLAAHELGHNFGLTHIDDLTLLFGATNVMYSSSFVRKYFTEGQLFRAHLLSHSALNPASNVYSVRPNIQRDCERITTGTAVCPAIQKRIWADGPSYPPN